jgi:subtilase family serine protease
MSVLKINTHTPMNIKTNTLPEKKLNRRLLVIFVLAVMSGIQTVGSAEAAVKIPRSFKDFDARPPIHTLSGGQITATPQGLSPANLKMAYNLPSTGGTGTIAIVSAYRHPAIESDLAIFDKQFSLPACTAANKCLEVHAMGTSTKTDSGWSLESALDTEWAHAIAPGAKILVVESASTKGADLIKAVDYARGRADVVAISMSWGGDEFGDETALDTHFTSTSVSAHHPITFFASSGDDGNGASWPAVSPNVVAVGGTSLNINKSGHFISEKAWAGSGGGVSAYETEPSYQIAYSIPHSNNKRAIPDVAYAADPVYGFSVYHIENPSGKSAAALAKGWYVVGGTSAGAPQWAAIQALGKNVSLANLYQDKAGPVYATFFRDIVSGKNGNCAYYCNARAHYDYVTGLGSPITDKF